MQIRQRIRSGEDELMINDQDVNFEQETMENLTVQEIRGMYKDELILWISGSGVGPGRPCGCYYGLLDYKDNVRYMEGEFPNATANQAMIRGLTEMVQAVKKPLRLIAVSPCPLGFTAGFRGKGTNGTLIQDALRGIKEKGCSLTALVLPGQAEELRMWIMEHSGRKVESKKNKYKEMIYRECLGQVTEILKASGIDSGIIGRIEMIEPLE